MGFVDSGRHLYRGYAEGATAAEGPRSDAADVRWADGLRVWVYSCAACWMLRAHLRVVCAVDRQRAASVPTLERRTLTEDRCCTAR